MTNKEALKLWDEEKKYINPDFNVGNKIELINSHAMLYRENLVMKIKLEEVIPNAQKVSSMLIKILETNA